MLKLKKVILIHKIKKIFNEELIILLFNYNTINVKTSYQLKKDLAKIKDIKILIVNNKLVSFSLNSEKKKRNHLFIQEKPINDVMVPLITPFLDIFQGPMFLISCKSIKNISLIFHIIEKYKNFLFVGGKIQNQLITHLDLNKLVSVDNNKKNFLIPLLLQQLGSKLSILQKYNFFLSRNINSLYYIKVFQFFTILGKMKNKLE